jgi:ABC-type antimicrobial peptide transport system permease subunit
LRDLAAIVGFFRPCDPPRLLGPARRASRIDIAEALRYE